MPDTTPSFLLQILILLGSATLLVTLFYRLRIPSLLGFILVGIVFGPTGLHLIADPTELHIIAELGLVFLLFSLGLEFSLPRLIALRNTVFKLGAAQVIICSAAFFCAFYSWGLAWQTALLVSGALSLSSTAIVSRELSRAGQLHTRHGQIAIGILLFQDIVAVFLIAAVPILSGDLSPTASLYQLAWLIIKSCALFISLLWIGRYLLPKLLIEIARVHSDELLVLAAVVIVLAAGSLTSALGLGMELGAFFAGMMLGEGRFRHQLEANIRPFRDVLLGLFFISIGMLVDVALLQEYWLRIILCGALLMLFKATIIAGAARLMGEPLRIAVPSGIALAQGGEFLFALLALATRDHLIPADVAAFLISVTLVSMALTPPFIRHSMPWIERVFGQAKKSNPPEMPSITAQEAAHLNQHVIILGFGRVGQTIARFLRALNIPYLALDKDIARIVETNIEDKSIFYGDPTRLEILKSSGIERAALLVISFDHPILAEHILHQVRELCPDLPVLARTRDDSVLDDLLAAGASEVVPETLEASFMLVFHVLLLLNVPTEKIHEVIQQARRDRYRML